MSRGWRSPSAKVVTTQAQYEAGQHVSGEVYLQVTNDIEFEKLTLEITGVEAVRFRNPLRGERRDGRPVVKKAIAKDRREIFRSVATLYEPPTGGLAVGLYRFPFVFVLPTDLPGSASVAGADYDKFQLGDYHAEVKYFLRANCEQACVLIEDVYKEVREKQLAEALAEKNAANAAKEEQRARARAAAARFREAEAAAEAAERRGKNTAAEAAEAAAAAPSNGNDAAAAAAVPSDGNNAPAAAELPLIGNNAPAAAEASLNGDNAAAAAAPLPNGNDAAAAAAPPNGDNAAAAAKAPLNGDSAAAAEEAPPIIAASAGAAPMASAADQPEKLLFYGDPDRKEKPPFRSHAADGRLRAELPLFALEEIFIMEPQREEAPPHLVEQKIEAKPLLLRCLKPKFVVAAVWLNNTVVCDGDVFAVNVEFENPTRSSIYDVVLAFWRITTLKIPGMQPREMRSRLLFQNITPVPGGYKFRQEGALTIDFDMAIGLQQTVKTRFFDVNYRLTLTGLYKKTEVDVAEEVIVRNRIISQTNHLLKLQPSSDWEFVQPETEVTRIQVDGAPAPDLENFDALKYVKVDEDGGTFSLDTKQVGAEE